MSIELSREELLKKFKELYPYSDDHLRWHYFKQFYQMGFTEGIKQGVSQQTKNNE